MVQAIRRAAAMEVVSDGESEVYDLVALATGVNGQLPALHGLDYRPPRTGTMCQTELHLGSEEVDRRLGAAVHIFLPPDDIATYGMLIPKSPFVTVSLLNARRQMSSLHQFLRLDEVRAVLGGAARPVCGCLPRISLGPAWGTATTGFVAIGDAGSTRLYKNGIGSALATAERAAWTAIHQGISQSAWSRHYLPLCRTIDGDNRIGRLLFLEAPVLKRLGLLAGAHYRLATRTQRHPEVSQLHARILWGMFTGAYSYRELLRMSLTPRLLGQWVLESLRYLIRP
jgi:flavin-dependent dehydrogenase